MSRKKIAIAADGLSGVIAAALFQKQGHDVILVEPDESWTPELQRLQIPATFLPDSDENRTALHNLGSLTGHHIETAAVASPVRTFEDNGWRDFVGFGDNKSVAVNLMSKLPTSGWIKIISNLNLIWDTLDQLTNTAATKFKRLKFTEITGVETNGTSVTAFLTNGAEKIETDLFVYLLSPRNLIKMLQGEGLGTRTQSRILKTTTCMRLVLEIDKMPELPALSFLVPKSDHEAPVLVTAGDQTICETFLAEDDLDNEDALAKALRSIKKQLKRASNGQEPKYGRVSLLPDYVADFAWFSEAEGSTLGFDNLVFSSHLCHAGWSIVPSVTSAFVAVDQLHKLEGKSTGEQDKQPSILSS